MNKIWFIVIGLGIYYGFSLKGSISDSGKVNPEEIYGRWSTVDETIWFEFYHNGMVTGEFEEGEFVGSYRQLQGGDDFEILKTRRGERQMVFLRDERLVCLNQHVEYRLKKKKEFVPGTVQRRK